MSAPVAAYFSPELARYVNARTLARKQLTPPSQANAILIELRNLTINSCPIGTVPNPDPQRNNVLTNDEAKAFINEIITYFLEASTSPQLEMEDEEVIYFLASHPGQIAAPAGGGLPAVPVVVAGQHLVGCSMNTIIHIITHTTTARYQSPTTVRKFMRWFTSMARILAADKTIEINGLQHGVPAKYRSIAFDFIYPPFGRLTQDEELVLKAAQFVALEPQAEITNTDARYHGGVRTRATRNLLR